MTQATRRWWRGKGLVYLSLGILVWSAWSLTPASPPSSVPTEPPKPAAAVGPTIEVAGRTQCILTRHFTIAPVPLHPVTEVLVEPGSRVKKGQILVKIDDDEPKADVRVKQAALENAQIALKEARRYLAQSEKVYQTGALPEQRYHEIRVGALKAEKDEQLAKAALDSAKAELEHYEVTAEIEGVVSWLEVHPGMVSRPGTTVWGEILDLRELDVRCEVPLDQVEQLRVGQPAEVRKKGKKELFGSGKVIFVGISVDPKTDLVPVLVRLPNPELRLRCGEPVQVRFNDSH